MPTLNLELLGLTCSGCVNKVTEALLQHPQVESAEVSQHHATIQGNISAEEAIELIENLGFEAE